MATYACSVYDTSLSGDFGPTIQFYQQSTGWTAATAYFRFQDHFADRPAVCYNFPLDLSSDYFSITPELPAPSLLYSFTAWVDLTAPGLSQRYNITPISFFSVPFATQYSPPPVFFTSFVPFIDFGSLNISYTLASVARLQIHAATTTLPPDLYYKTPDLSSHACSFYASVHILATYNADPFRNIDHGRFAMPASYASNPYLYWLITADIYGQPSPSIIGPARMTDLIK